MPEHPLPFILSLGVPRHTLCGIIARSFRATLCLRVHSWVTPIQISKTHAKCSFTTTPLTLRLAYPATHRPFLLFAHPTYASLFSDPPQSSSPTSAVSGTVLDPSASFIPGAEVSLATAGGKIIAKATTDANGVFRFEKFPSGKYELYIHAAGFRDATSPARRFQLNFEFKF